MHDRTTGKEGGDPAPGACCAEARRAERARCAEELDGYADGQEQRAALWVSRGPGAADLADASRDGALWLRRAAEHLRRGPPALAPAPEAGERAIEEIAWREAERQERRAEAAERALRAAGIPLPTAVARR